METILLVEDEALIAMSEAGMLKKHGYEVLTAYNARKAIETTDWVMLPNRSKPCS